MYSRNECKNIYKNVCVCLKLPLKVIESQFYKYVCMSIKTNPFEI